MSYTINYLISNNHFKIDALIKIFNNFNNQNMKEKTKPSILRELKKL